LKIIRSKRVSRPAPFRELAGIRTRLAVAEETLRSVRTGGVDTLVIAGKHGPQVFTLQGAEQAYRVLIESMNEGALTLTNKKMILCANQCFARMVRCPLEQVTGSSLRRFLSAADRATLRSHFKRLAPSGSKIQVLLLAGDGSQIPVQISIRPVASDGTNRRVIGMVVTDLTESVRNEKMLRTLTNRVVQTQEAERRRVALELHDKITQPLCAILIRWQALADKLPAGEGPTKAEALKLRDVLGQTTSEVERISRDLRPSVLEHLGLVAVLHDTSTKFAKRIGVSLKLACVSLNARLPAEIELTLYRLLQGALTNVERHARARHVTVRLTKPGDLVQLTITDDGVGFDPDHHPAQRKGKEGVGLLSMRERAAFAGGILTIKSGRRTGTEIKICIPVPPGATDST